MKTTQFLRRTSSDHQSTMTGPTIGVQRLTMSNSSSTAYGDNGIPEVGGNSDLTSVLLLVSMLFGLFFLMARMQCYFRYRAREEGTDNNGEPGNDNPQNLTSSGRPKARTQELIKQMVVLKNVFWVSSDEENAAAAKGSNSTTNIDAPPPPPHPHHKRCKSNLLLDDGQKEEYGGKQTCPICLCDYEEGDQICWSRNPECSHHFHATCGMAWLAKHSECPICRAEYLVSPSPQLPQTDEETPPDDALVEQLQVEEHHGIIEDDGQDIVLLEPRLLHIPGGSDDAAPTTSVDDAVIADQEASTTTTNLPPEGLHEHSEEDATTSGGGDEEKADESENEEDVVVSNNYDEGSVAVVHERRPSSNEINDDTAISSAI